MTLRSMEEEEEDDNVERKRRMTLRFMLEKEDGDVEINGGRGG